MNIGLKLIINYFSTKRLHPNQKKQLPPRSLEKGSQKEKSAKMRKKMVL